ncbi:hypothetical protein PPL_01661 [Heterostelium album PN500]|uniref:IPT/TIG domain-containing protein n=1 Tax=Heterostelium pallidum (strain ATCC 26659 / Pp 5 / PN500) TaxID=670386 RepID=D3B047_HETP5|nr:hypothetical protein PPL_01661 [Heterostelium album PN500]EFA84671.1 hypothetical protein PPL_01661 [Heterostelium album PN500]|eukprot:XP_020436784.1 hypothetical protein PPL_01661 [Heterostelium album PN500]
MNDPENKNNFTKETQINGNDGIDLNNATGSASQLNIFYKENKNHHFLGTYTLNTANVSYSFNLNDIPNVNYTQIGNIIKLSLCFNIGNTVSSVTVKGEAAQFVQFNDYWDMNVTVPSNMSDNIATVKIEFKPDPVSTNRIPSKSIDLTLKPFINNQDQIPVSGIAPITLTGGFLNQLLLQSDTKITHIHFNSTNNNVNSKNNLICNNVTVKSNEEISCILESGAGVYDYQYSFSGDGANQSLLPPDINKVVRLSFEEPIIKSASVVDDVLLIEGSGFNEPISVTINENTKCTLPKISNFTNIKCNITTDTKIHTIRVDVANQHDEYLLHDDLSSSSYIKTNFLYLITLLPLLLLSSI